MIGWIIILLQVIILVKVFLNRKTNRAAYRKGHYEGCAVTRVKVLEHLSNAGECSDYIGAIKPLFEEISIRDNKKYLRGKDVLS